MGLQSTHLTRPKAARQHGHALFALARHCSGSCAPNYGTTMAKHDEQVHPGSEDHSGCSTSILAQQNMGLSSHMRPECPPHSFQAPSPVSHPPAAPHGQTAPIWQSLVIRQFSRAMGHLYRPTHPFDFLLYYPNKNSKWLHLWELHPQWLHVWTQWAAIPMKEHVPVPPRLEVLLDMPIWLTKYAPMLDNSNECVANLVNSPQLRRWCMFGIANGLYCLHDFLRINGRWPTRASFMAAMSSGNPEARLELGPTGSIQLAIPNRAATLYTHLTKTYHRLIHMHLHAESHQPARQILPTPAATPPCSSVAFLPLLNDGPKCTSVLSPTMHQPAMFLTPWPLLYVTLLMPFQSTCG
ncbi:hypothetical protein THRCLA_05736 [Thraustotheca clavata]|uniref:Uncharacterized protein n=1 Tax=Thraustotheca clavata TaxID=74557 RepID=A0A1V9ZUY3_9STRA|nr:hypothetical protein THRCLA_05736 [Thraustotheca clavata]